MRHRLASLSSCAVAVAALAGCALESLEPAGGRLQRCGAPAVCGGEILWGKHLGGPGRQVPAAVAVDPAGHVVLAGFVGKSLEIDDETLVSEGGPGLFVAALDAGGALLWSHPLGTANLLGNVKVATDAQGNILLAVTREPAPDPASGVASGSELLLAKLDAEGNEIWKKSILTPDSDAKLTSIAVGPEGEVGVLGEIGHDAIDLGGGPLLEEAGNGEGEMVVAKFGPSGEHLWSQRLGGDAAWLHADALRFDRDGGVVLAGSFSGDLTLGDFALWTWSETAVFVARLDASGDVIHGADFGRRSESWGRVSLAVDPSGNAVLTGNLPGETSFGGEPLVDERQYAYYYGPHLFVAKLAPGGELLWDRPIVGDGNAWGEGVEADAAGNILVSGRFHYSFDAGDGPLESSGSTDEPLLLKMTPGGDHVWSRRFDVPTGETGVNHLAVGTAGDVALLCPFRGVLDLGDGPVTSLDEQDMFLVHVAP